MKRLPQRQSSRRENFTKPFFLILAINRVKKKMYLIETGVSISGLHAK